MKKLCVALVAALAVTASGALAQTYPSQPVTIVNPFPPGGSVDTTARAIAAVLTEKFGQSFLVDNRPGATGSVGTASALAADPDGYTILLGNSDPLAANLVNFPDLPYDPRTDLEPIALLYKSVFAVVVTNDLPVNTFEEFIEYARANPGTLSYGSSGVGSSMNFAGEVLKREAGIDMEHIPYQGGAAAVTDVIGGQLTVSMSTLPSVVEHHNEGQLKILAISHNERLPELPDIPTVSEFYPDYVLHGWGALVAPKGTPAEIKETLRAAAMEALEDESVKRVLKASGLLVAGDTADVVTAMIHNEIMMRQAVLDSGIVAQ